jgi:hypothetical protein
MAKFGPLRREIAQPPRSFSLAMGGSPRGTLVGVKEDSSFPKTGGLHIAAGQFLYLTELNESARMFKWQATTYGISVT